MGTVVERPDPIWKAWVVFPVNSIWRLLEWILTLTLVVVAIPCMFIAKKWKRVFILSCVAVSFDCLFLYIPIIDQEHKCLGIDKTLRNVALVLRSLTDIAFIVHIVLLITGEMDMDRKWDDHNSDSDHPAAASWLPKPLDLVREAIAQKIPWLSISIVVNFLAILPIPQVAIVVGFFRFGGSKHFPKQTIINVFLVIQYCLRISQIFLSIKKVGDTVGILVKGSFYFLLYIIASHVLAAFWYFFSIQRETTCWDQACRVIAGCKPIYDCSRSFSLDSTSLDKLCPIDSPNATLFDFGIFLDILQSGITGSTKFSTKFFYSLWWGLRNLSNFGTNLETSSYIWENCFAILICVIGLLLFLFLIGNVQTYIQSESEKFVRIRESRRTRINTKYKDIEKWMSSHDLPDYMKIDIWKNITEDKVVECITKDVDPQFMERFYHRNAVKSDPLKFICLNALKKIPILQNMDERGLKVFLGSYSNYIPLEKDSYITRAGGRLDALYLIIEGVIECKDGSSPMSTPTTRRRYDYVGEEVLRWAISNHNTSYSNRGPPPISKVDVKCQTKIGAFKFNAIDLIQIIEQLKTLKRLEALALGHGSKTDYRIKDWFLRLPEDLKANIMNCLDKKGSMDAAVDVDFLFDILPKDIKPSIKRHLGMNALKKVPMLQQMHEYVLEIICNHLETVVYKINSYVVRAGEPLCLMIFILGGAIILTDATTSNATTRSSSEITESCGDRILGEGGFYGEQLLSWASPNNISSPENPIISTRDVKCQTKVEALILKANDLKNAASKCGSQWNFNNFMNSQQLVDDGRDRVAETAPTSPIEETIRLHQGHDIILEQLVLIRETIFRRLDDQGRRLDEMAAFLARVGYTGITGTSSTTPSAP